MSIRDGYKINDIHDCIFKLLDAKSTSPWNRWNVIRGYPSTEVFANFTQPLIYLEAPKKINEIRQMGARSLQLWSSILGVWTDRITGSIEEQNIMEGTIFDFFDNFVSCHTSTFTVTLGTTTYTNTTLNAMKIGIDSISGFENRPTEDEKEFRSECTLLILA